MRATKGLLKGLNPTMAMTALTVVTLFLLFGVFDPDTAGTWFTGAKDGFPWLGGLVAEQQALQITRQQIDLKVHPAARTVVVHDGFAQGVRDDGQREFGAIDRVHGQAGAVDRDRAFMGDVLGQLFRRADAEFDGAGVLFAGDHLADAVHVTAYQMTAQTRGRRQGFFEVDPAARFQVIESRAVQRLATDVGHKAVARQLNGCQANAVDGNAVAEFDVAQVELAGLYINPYIATFWGQCTDVADGFDNAGKHGVPLENQACVKRRLRIIRWLMAQVWQ